jgi:hypothetical protein
MREDTVISAVVEGLLVSVTAFDTASSDSEDGPDFIDATVTFGDDKWRVSTPYCVERDGDIWSFGDYPVTDNMSKNLVSEQYEFFLDGRKYTNEKLVQRKKIADFVCETLSDWLRCHYGQLTDKLKTEIAKQMSIVYAHEEVIPEFLRDDWEEAKEATPVTWINHLHLEQITSRLADEVECALRRKSAA